MRSRVLHVVFAGIAGLGLATVATSDIPAERDIVSSIPPATNPDGKSHKLAAASGNPRISATLARTGDVRWLDPQDIGATIQAPVDLRAAGDAIALASPRSAASDASPLGETSVASAYAPVNEPIDTAESPAAISSPPAVRSNLPALEFDADFARDAIKAYRAGDLARGDELSRRIDNEVGRETLEWTALRLQPRLAGFARINAFLEAHPDWSAAQSIRRRAEQALLSERKKLDPIRTYFADRKPLSVSGKLALARADLEDGKRNDAMALVADVWRNEELGAPLEAAVRKEFGDLLTAADHKFRSDRLFYREKEGPSARAAAYAGPDVTALARARAAILAGAKSDKLLAAVPKALQADLSLAYARIQRLRHDNKILEAAQAMLTASRDPAAIVDGDAWWVERRLLARKLVDSGDPATAYKVAADHSAASAESKIDAEFHAGWIALRFQQDAAAAEPHFEAAMRIAETPMSKARFAYWLGRTHEAAGKPDDAKLSYQLAAASPATFYGQLARARLGIRDAALRMPDRIALGSDRLMTTRVVEALQGLGEGDLALGLAVEAARTIDDQAQLAALAQVMIDARDARGTLAIGKVAAQRGYSLDAAAFPTFGIPTFEPAANSADTPVVYAIARQESAFQANAVSSAGARGLMQMIASTARRTAQRVGVPFDFDRMTKDPAFNARLGAAHLGDLLTENNGSMILTFAAYNAGGKRVKEWIAAYGDPRRPDVDPIDWIERIPFTETRNYVQRVVENLEMYRMQFATDAPRLVDKDLRVVASQF